MKDRDGPLVERTRRPAQTLEDFYWREMIEFEPDVPGHYLVVQRHAASTTSPRNRVRAYRWVRYWDGTDWYDSKADKYGPIVYWMPMPSVPNERNRRDR